MRTTLKTTALILTLLLTVSIASADDPDYALERTVDRGEVELEVARVQDHALRSVERRDVARRDRVGDGQELAVERPDHPPVAVVDLAELRLVEQPWRERQLAAAARGGQRDPRLDEIRWMLEELRVSLFAQPLGTSVKVSPDRLQRLWREMQRGRTG